MKYIVTVQEKLQKKEKTLKTVLGFESLKRCLADSNRRRRFCRPLTKPLIQGTVSVNKERCLHQLF